MIATVYVCTNPTVEVPLDMVRGQVGVVIHEQVGVKQADERLPELPHHGVS